MREREGKREITKKRGRVERKEGEKGKRKGERERERGREREREGRREKIDQKR